MKLWNFAKKSGYPVDYKGELKGLSWGFTDGPKNCAYVIAENSKNGIGICVQESEDNGRPPQLMLSHVLINNCDKYLKSKKDEETSTLAQMEN